MMLFLSVHRPGRTSRLPYAGIQAKLIVDWVPSIAETNPAVHRQTISVSLDRHPVISE
jgi:hypothetical protein